MKPRLFKTQSAMQAFMLSQTARGHVWSVLVMHDSICTPSVCRCRPWYEVRPATPETIIEGARAQAKWVKETTS